MTYKFSNRSKEKLYGVHNDLVKVAIRALELSPVDFAITEGLRTKNRQSELVKAGASKIMNSMHITGHAIDVAAFVGEIRWDFGLYLKIAEAFKKASIELGIPIVWGGCWRRLSEVDDIDKAVADYVARKRIEGKKALVDGPHFELDKLVYAQ